MSKDKKKEFSKTVLKVLRSTNEFIKSNPNEKGDYDLKKSQPHKKQTWRVIESTCLHWRLDKNDTVQPAVVELSNKPGWVRCRICKAEFPLALKPIDPAFQDQSPYTKEIDDFLAAVNTTALFYAKFSKGDGDDIGVLASLRRGCKEFRKISYGVSYAFTKQRQANGRANQAASDFNAYNNTGLIFR